LLRMGFLAPTWAAYSAPTQCATVRLQTVPSVAGEISAPRKTAPGGIAWVIGMPKVVAAP